MRTEIGTALEHAPEPFAGMPLAVSPLCRPPVPGAIMPASLKIPASGALDLLSLGALVHRLDPGAIPFRKANQFQIHVSGGEFNVAANLADCFRLRTGVVSAMVDYPIGDLIAERVR